MPATTYPEFNAAVTELTNKVSSLLAEIASLQSLANIQTAVDKAAAAEASSALCDTYRAAAAVSAAAALEQAGISSGNRVSAAASEAAASTKASDAQAAATLAQASSLLASDAAELAKVAAVYPTYAEAYDAVWTLPDGAIVRVLTDETRSGRSSWYKTVTPTGPSLSLDFGLGSYAQAEHPLTFVKSDDLRQVAVPATSTAVGSVGDYAVNATHFYLAVASNVWKRAALSEF